MCEHETHFIYLQCITYFMNVHVCCFCRQILCAAHNVGSKRTEELFFTFYLLAVPGGILCRRIVTVWQSFAAFCLISNVTEWHIIKNPRKTPKTTSSLWVVVVFYNWFLGGEKAGIVKVAQKRKGCMPVCDVEWQNFNSNTSGCLVHPPN